MLRSRIRPEIDPDEYLRSHPVLTASDLAAASQVGQLPGTEEELPAFSLDEAEATLPGIAPTASAPLGIGWDDVRGGLNRAASGLTSGLRSVGDLARRAPPLNPWQGEPAPNEMSVSLNEVEAAPQPAPMAQPAQLPGTLPDAPEQPAAAPAAPLQAAAAPAQPSHGPGGAEPSSLPGTALDPYPMPNVRNPFAQTEDDRKALEEAEKRDNRLRIAAGIMRGLGFMTQLGAGIAGNNALGNAAGAAATNFAPQIDGAEQVRARIAERQANDYRAMQFDQSQRQAAMQAAAEQQQFALRSRMAQSTEQLNQARAEQERLRTQQMQDEWAQVRGNREAGIAWLRSLASQYPNAPLAQGILSGTVDGAPLSGASLQQLDHYASQFANMANAGQVAGRAAIGRSPGGGGPSLPGPGGGPPVDTSIDNRVREFLRLQDVDLDTEAGQYALATALERAHGDSTESRAFRAEMDQAFSSTASGGDVYPAGVDRATYTRIAPQVAEIRQQVQPLRTAVAYLNRAIESGLDTAGWQAIRNGGGLADRVAQQYGLPDLRGIVQNARDSFARLRSGAAISQTEWESFNRILSDDSIFTSPQRLRDALHRLNADAAAVARARFDAAGPGYWELYQRRTGGRR